MPTNIDNTINLSEPMYSPIIDRQNENDELKESSKAEAESAEHVKPSQREDAAHHSEAKLQGKTMVAPPKVQESFGDKVLRAVDAVKEFSERHPVLTEIVKLGGIAAAARITTAVANNSSGGGRSSGNSGADTSSSDLFDDSGQADDNDDYSDSSASRDYPDERASPKKHTVPAHGQHYHTQGGVIYGKDTH